MPTPNTPETPAAAPAPTDEETFASAFAEAVDADTPGAAPAAPAAETPAAPAPAPAPEPPAETAPAEEAPAPAPVEEEPPEAKIARLEAENAALTALKHAPAAPAAPEAPAPPAPTAEAPAAPAAAPAPAEPVWYQPSDEEKTVLTDLEKNWPDIALAQQVAIKQAVYNAVQYTFSQIQKTYNPALQRFAELSDVISEQLALSALRGEHADYDEVYDRVVTWVDTLPAAFKAGAKLTMTQGTPEEVAELISEYKKTHPTATAAAPAPLAPQVAGKTELSAAAKQAASRLRVVGSKRTTPVAAPDPNDFESAWNEAVNSGN